MNSIIQLIFFEIEDRIKSISYNKDGKIHLIINKRCTLIEIQIYILRGLIHQFLRLNKKIDSIPNYDNHFNCDVNFYNLLSKVEHPFGLDSFDIILDYSNGIEYKIPKIIDKDGNLIQLNNDVIYNIEYNSDYSLQNTFESKINLDQIRKWE